MVGKSQVIPPKQPSGGLAHLASLAPTAEAREAITEYQRLAANVPKVAAAPHIKAVPSAQEAHVMTRAEWQAARDKAGGKAGMVRGVDVGSLLHAWHKTMSGNPSFTVASRNLDKQTYALIVGLNKYKKDPAVAKTLALRETAERLLKAIDAHVARAGTADKQARALGEELKTLRTIAISEPLKFMQLQRQVKLVGTAFRDLSTVDSSVFAIANWWNRQVDQRVSRGGVAAAKSDTLDYQRASAAGLANLADAVRTELAKNRIVT